MVDVTVVGGGLAGLICANLLAKAGKSVALFEKGKELGGRARTENDRGFLMNLGPHALYRSGEAARILREDLDIIPAGKLAPTTGALLLRKGRTHLLPGTLGTLLRTRALGVTAKLEVAKAFGRLPHIDPLPLQRVTVNDWLKECVPGAEAREFLRALLRLTTYANDPDLQGAGAALGQLQAGLGGVYYLDGGWQSMIDILREQAIHKGVRIETSGGVRRVMANQSLAEGVQCADGRVERSRWVVLATPPDAASELLAETPNHPVHRVAKESVPVHAACLNIGLRSLPRPQHRFLLGMDEPFYYSVHSLTARLAPLGGGVIHLARYLSSTGEPTAEKTRRQLEAILDRLQPGWQRELVVQQYLPKMTVVPALDLARRGGILGRPAVMGAEMANLMMAGDWVGSEGMLADASAAGAARCVEAILSGTSVGRHLSEALENVASV